MSMLPLIPTTVIGSYARPGWIACCVSCAQQGKFGPKDLDELENDAVDLAIRDQEEAGLDVISDGEMRRAGFFTAEFYSYIPGLESVAPLRLLGVTSHDQQHRFRTTQRISAPDGLGVVKEFAYAHTRTRKPLVMPIPGPYTLAGRIVTGPQEIYKTREEVAWEMVPLLQREIRDLIAAGAKYIQIDEPTPVIHKVKDVDIVSLFNAVIDGIQKPADVELWCHLCFGNFVGRPYAKRSYAGVIDDVARFKVDQIHLEFAGVEMNEIEVAASLASIFKRVNIGVIDVKSHYHETADDVAVRIRKALKYIPAAKLAVAPDCGFSQTPRAGAKAKAIALVAGARIVRQELTGKL